MDLTVLNLAVPPLSADLQPSSAQLLWIVDIYGFLVAGSLITMGTLGDRIGRRRLLLIGAAAFGVASVLAAFSTSAEMLIATRALLGIAGATLAPSTLSLIRNMFHDPGQRTVAIGVWITSFSVGGAIGPLLGGLLLEYFWWGSVFLLARAGDGAAAGGRAARCCRSIRDPDAGPARPAQRGAVAGRRAGGDLRPQADRRGRPRLAARAVSIVAGLALGVVVRAPAADAGRSADRPAALPRARLQRVAGHLHARHLRRCSASSSSSRSTCSWCSGCRRSRRACGRCPRAAAFIVGSHAGPAARAPGPPGVRDGAGLALAAVGFGVLTQVDGDPRPRGPRRRRRVVFSLGLAPVLTLATDLIVGSRPARAGRRGLGDLGDQRRARRGARHRDPRAASAPPSTARRWPTRSRRASRRGGRGRARHARRRGRGRRGAARADWAPSCSRPPARRSPRGCSSPPLSAPPSRSARPPSP